MTQDRSMNLYESPRRAVPSRAGRWTTFFLVVVSIVGVCAAFRYQTAAARASELTAIRERKLPVTLAELDVWYASPSNAKNASNLYEEAFRLLLQGARPDEISVPIVGTNVMPSAQAPLTPSAMASAQAYLAKHQKTIEVLHQAALMPECRFPVTLEAGVDAELPHLRPLHVATRLLILDGMVRAENNDGEGAAESLMGALGVAQALKDEPLLLSQSARIANLTVAVQGVEQVLNRTKLTDHLLGRLGNALERAQSTESLARAIAGERAILINSVSGVPSLDRASASAASPAALSALGERLYLWSGARDQDLTFALRGYRDLMDVAALPVHLRRVALASVSARFDAMPSRFVVSRQLMPPLVDVAREELRAAALCRAARVAVAVERCRLARSSLPDSLDELLPEHLPVIPGDPFAPHPLRYDRLGVRYTVYSVGPDGRDDGGTPAQRGSDDASGDIVFVVQR
jgi:hypothetical protein